MAQWSISAGSSIDLYLSVTENWNAATQTSLHVRAFLVRKTTGTSPVYGSGSWSGNVGGVTGSWSGAYSVPAGFGGQQTWWEFDHTYNKDANGNFSITAAFSVNGNNSPYFVAAGISEPYSAGRIGLAPSITSATSNTITSTTANIAMYVANYGNGTSATNQMYYKKTSDGSWTGTSTTSGTGTKTFGLTGLTTNQAYHILARSTNNMGDVRNLPSSYPSSSYIFRTKPAAPVMSTPSELKPNRVVIPTTTSTGGNAYTITKQYRIKEADGAYGSWTTYTGNDISITDLSPKTDYVVEVQSVTTAGTTVGSTLSFTTKSVSGNFLPLMMG